MTSDQLRSLYASNQKLFYELANKWFKDDPQYYKDYVFPIINQNKTSVSTPLKRKKSSIIMVVLICLGSGIFFLYTNTKVFTNYKSNPSSDNMITMSSEEFSNIYQANEVAADRKYKGELIKIQGPVLDISKGTFGEAVVSLRTSDRWSPIRCKMDFGNKGKASNLTKGDTVTIIGKCKGMTIGTVYLEDCEIY